MLPFDFVLYMDNMIIGCNFRCRNKYNFTEPLWKENVPTEGNLETRCHLSTLLHLTFSLWSSFKGRVYEKKFAIYTNWRRIVETKARQLMKKFGDEYFPVSRFTSRKRSTNNNRHYNLIFRNHFGKPKLNQL